MKTTASIVIPALSLLFLMSLSACGGDEPASADQTTTVPVRVQQVGKDQVAQAYRYAGTVQGTNKVQLSTRMLGRITYLQVEEGARVRQGQTLVRIKSEDVEAQKEQVLASLREAEAALSSAETDFQRMQTLFDAESATKKEYEDASTRYKMAQARRAALQGKLSEVDDVLGYAVVTAPTDGYVVQKMAEEGAIASPGMPLLVIENTGTLEVIAQVPESDIDRFVAGDTVAIEIGALGDRTTRGIVTQINPSGHTASRQFEVQIRMMDGDPEIKSGMYARVVLQKGERAVISVPEDALINRGQLVGLYTVDQQNRALLRWVRTGKRYDNRVEILSGLSEGETYIAAYKGRLTDGQSVQIVN